MAEHEAKIDPLKPGQDPEGQSVPEDAAPLKVPPTHAPVAVFDDDSMFNAADPQAEALSPGQRGSDDAKPKAKSQSKKNKQRKAS